MMAKNRHDSAREIPEVAFAAPAGTPAGVEVMSLAELRQRVCEQTLARPQRPDFHHLLVLTEGNLWHVVDFDGYALRPGSWLWVRPGQVHQWGDLTKVEGTLILFQQDMLDPTTATVARVDDPHAPVIITPVADDAEAVTMAAEHLSREFRSLGHLPLDVHIAALRHLLAVLLLSGSVPASAPVAAPKATAVGIARARILSPAEVRRFGDRIEVRTGEPKAPTQVHRTERSDGGETADFY